MNKTKKVPPKRLIDAFNHQISELVESHGMTASCLVTSAILSEFLTHYMIKHEVVSGYITMADMFFTEHVWVEVTYKKGVVEYDVSDDVFGDAFRAKNATIRRVRERPKNMKRLQDTKKEVMELRVLMRGVEMFKENRAKFYEVLSERDKKLHNNTWKKILVGLTMWTIAVNHHVDLVKRIMGSSVEKEMKNVYDKID